jgi:hypothetical protein
MSCPESWVRAARKYSKAVWPDETAGPTSGLSTNCQHSASCYPLMMNIHACRIFTVPRPCDLTTARRTGAAREISHSSRSWRRSSASTPKNDCVEVLQGRTLVSVRDSKARTGSQLRFALEAWVGFLDRLREDR